MLASLFNFVIFSTQTLATTQKEIEQALEGMCEKLRQCAVESMQAEDLPQSMLDMMSQQVSLQCKQFMNVEQTIDESEQRIKQGITCLNDMAAMPCETLTMGTDPESCAVFKNSD